MWTRPSWGFPGCLRCPVGAPPARSGVAGSGLGWPETFLNAAMLLGGLRVVDPFHATAGEWLAGVNVLVVGVVFLVPGGVMVARVTNQVIQRVRLGADRMRAGTA